MFEIIWGSGGGAPGKIFVNLRSILPGASREKNGVKIFKFRPTLFLVNPVFDRPGFRAARVLIDPGLSHQKINPGIIAVPYSRKFHYCSYGLPNIIFEKSIFLWPKWNFKCRKRETSFMFQTKSSIVKRWYEKNYVSHFLHLKFHFGHKKMDFSKLMFGSP